MNGAVYITITNSRLNMRNSRNLSDQDIQENRSEIIDLLRSTHRPGIENVISYLDKTGFFVVPSRPFHGSHHNWKGGLAQHSLGVYYSARRNNADGYLSDKSLIISCLLHDICKARIYTYRPDGKFFENHLHIKGHGSRSVKLLHMLHLELRDTEYEAIRHHMTKPSFGDRKERWNLRQIVYRSDHKDASGANLVADFLK